MPAVPSHAPGLGGGAVGKHRSAGEIVPVPLSEGVRPQMTRYPAFSRPGNDSKRRNSMRRRLLFILGLPMMLAAFVMSAEQHSKSSVRNPEGARADPDKRCVPGRV